MATWMRFFWERIRDSLWFLPGLMSFGAGLLVMICSWLEQHIQLLGGWSGMFYQGDLAGIRALLSTLAGSMITVAGVTFSMTMVALSLASSQLGPRLLVNFMRDRGNQTVLGAFIGTFLFCLLAMGNAPTGAAPMVSVSASVGLVLASVSLLLLIYFIHHIASSMQADTVIDMVADDLERSLARVFPEDVQTPGEGPEPDAPECVSAVAAGQTGYLQGVDIAGLLRLATEEDLLLRVLRRPGHFVIEQGPLVEILEGQLAGEATARRIQRRFIIGGHRTADQDPEYGVHQLVEIAVRALSPGINDPFTASTCVDRLGGVLSRIADRELRPPVRWDADGRPRVLLDGIDFTGVLDAAFNQIRQCARDTPSVSMRLLEALQHIAEATDRPDRREALARQGRMVVDSCADRMIPGDLAMFEQRYDTLRRTLEER